MKTPIPDNNESLTLEQMREETASHLHVDSVFDDPEFKQILEDTSHPLHPAVLAKHKEAFPHLYFDKEAADERLNAIYEAAVLEQKQNPTPTLFTNLYTPPILDESSFAQLAEVSGEAEEKITFPFIDKLPIPEPTEPTKPVSFWNDEPEQVSESIHKAVAPTIIPLPTPQNNPNQYPSIGQAPNAPSTSEFLPTIAPLAQTSAPIALPATLIDIPRAELPNICGHIRANRSSLSSNPNWNAQLDTQFEVCLEMVTFIENVAGQFPTYLRLPHIQHDGYSQREEVHTMEFIAGKLQFGLFENKTGQYEKCRTVWDAVTSAYQAGLSYKNHDELYTKESINLMIIDNDKMARKLERALPKEAKIAPVKVTVDRTAYEAAKAHWRECIIGKEAAINEWNLKVKQANAAMQAEKTKAGITR